MPIMCPRTSFENRFLLLNFLNYSLNQSVLSLNSILRLTTANTCTVEGLISLYWTVCFSSNEFNWMKIKNPKRNTAKRNFRLIWQNFNCRKMWPTFVILELNLTCRGAKVNCRPVKEPVHTTRLQGKRLPVFKQVWPTSGADMVAKIKLPILEGK